VKRRVEHHALEHLADDEAIEVEDSLWWLQGRKAIIRRYLEQARAYKAIHAIADIGCGSGGNLEVLSEYGVVLGVEPSPVLAQRARSRGIASSIIQKNAMQLDEALEVDLITYFDVLEHIEDDATMLQRVRMAVPRDHLVLVSVPGCPLLYGEHDRLLHHYRRYSQLALKDALSKGGYRLLNMEHFMFFLLPLAFVDRARDKMLALLHRGRTSINLAPVPPFLNRLLTGVVASEASLSRYARFPIGLWLFALAERSA